MAVHQDPADLSHGSRMAESERDKSTELEQLVERLRARDEDAFRELFFRFSRPIFYFFMNRQLATEECRDLTQDTFLGIYRNIEDLKDPARFKSWIFRIATNVWRNRSRKQAAEKRKGREISLDALDADSSGVRQSYHPSKEQTGLEKLLSDEQMAHLSRAMRELPPQMRQCLVLRLAHGLKHREIAEIMEIKVGTVKSQISQAKKRLQKQLNDQFTG